MADDDLSSPLLQSPRADQSHVIIAVQDDDSGSDPSDQDQHTRRNQTRHNFLIGNNHKDGSICWSGSSRNPYEFVGSDGLSVPGTTTADPFRNDTPGVTGVYEIVKIMVCVPIALARLVLFALCLLVGYIATKLALGGWKDNQNPMPRWRCRIMWITRLSSRFYHWIRRKGKPAPREIAPIVVSNHISYIEPIFYFYELSPTIVASESHDSLPFVGTIIRAMQVIYVNRFSQSSRKNAVSEIKRKASCNRFPRVLLFPEGTTTNGKFIISFQLGAFIPGYPIQPVVVRYPHIHFDQSWGNISLAKLMFRMFTQFHNFMEVEYLPVVFPSNNQKENALQFAEREKASIYMVEMARMESFLFQLFHISSNEAVGFLDKFLSMNPDSSGCVMLSEFLRVLRLKPCTLSVEVCLVQFFLPFL
ncbi:hypothetical protein Dsin_026241 [Dipteronia sinensis]|uniref:Phospholipid/glycerol acyltransferase domain-containing protein n=1 Tax=Dipteronia sinensis TaxID=43782 RepID=A0AAD9ZXX9_9ROSI|nr:hypothetical protein Dsin_026241 [Dipteronia sinensis]